jgi:hypothetical protein
MMNVLSVRELSLIDSAPAYNPAALLRQATVERNGFVHCLLFGRAMATVQPE